MGYIVDWSDPYFPRISDAPDGEPFNTVAMSVLHHHLQVIKSHLTAIERLLNDVLCRPHSRYNDKRRNNGTSCYDK